MSHECKNTKMFKKQKKTGKKKKSNEDHISICLFIYELRSYVETSYLEIISKYRLNPQKVTTLMKKTMLLIDRLEI